MSNLQRVIQFMPIFPVGPWVTHGSACVTVDGRVLYVYGEAGGVSGEGGSIRGVYFQNAVQMAHDITVVTDGGKAYRKGKPIEGSDHLIIEGHSSACSVWRHGGTLYLTAIYAEGEWAPVNANLILRSELWVSPSGNGGDWSKMADLHPPRLFNDFGAYPRGSMEHTAGVGTPLGGGQFGIPITAFIENNPLGRARGSIVVGSGSSWTITDEHGDYLANGSSRPGRRLVPHNGQMYWNSGGNGRAWSSVGNGYSWEHFHTLPEAYGLDPYLISEGGYMWRVMDGIRPKITRTVDPQNPQTPTSGDLGGWEVVGLLNMGNFLAPASSNNDGYGRGDGWLWQEVSDGTWMLFNHDKVWFVFGGWLLGALGHS